MTGKKLIEKSLGNAFWGVDMKLRNARGKKTKWTKAEAKKASRKIRRDKSWD